MPLCSLLMCLHNYACVREEGNIVLIHTIMMWEVDYEIILLKEWLGIHQQHKIGVKVR
jgi:hypothetical protein